MEKRHIAEYLYNPGGIVLHKPTNDIPKTASEIEIPWNWNDYFRHLSYWGLDQSASFSTVYPPNSAALYYLREYIRTANTIFAP